MKRLAFFILSIFACNLSIAQEADTLIASNTQEAASSNYSFIILCVIGIALYFIVKKRNQKKKLIKLNEEQRQLLLEHLKDKTIPFFRVKGMTQYDVKKPGGYIVELVAETDNKYDPFAVAVVHPTLGIVGHLPKGNQFIHEKAKTTKIQGAVEIGIARNGYPYGKFWLDPAVFSLDDIAQCVSLDIDDNFRP